MIDSLVPVHHTSQSLCNLQKTLVPYTFCTECSSRLCFTVWLATALPSQLHFTPSQLGTHGITLISMIYKCTSDFWKKILSYYIMLLSSVASFLSYIFSTSLNAHNFYKELSI
uniref:Uncharacterized protein n=1 Tax=Sphaerodactylus townsendi TaxID=933632 RepID=A0ACB8FIE6_9SAUR